MESEELRRKLNILEAKVDNLHVGLNLIIDKLNIIPNKEENIENTKSGKTIKRKDDKEY